MNLHRLTHRLRAGLRESEMAHLPLFYQLSHRANGFFDWRVGIDAVLVVEIDVVDAEAAQAGFTALAYIFGLAIDAPRHWIRRIANDSKLRSEDDLVALALDGASDELFV